MQRDKSGPCESDCGWRIPLCRVDKESLFGTWQLGQDLNDGREPAMQRFGEGTPGAQELQMQKA